jgi:hypothetical protein
MISQMKNIKIKSSIFGFSILLILCFGFFVNLKEVNSDVTINFGINNLNPWVQTKDADLRIEGGSLIGAGGFTNPLPSDPSEGLFCGTADYPNSYSSLPGGGNTPGIIFTGNNDYSFGFGRASADPYNWVVGGADTGDYNSRLIRKTSYDFIYAKAKQGGLTPIDITNDTSGGSPVNHCTSTLLDCDLDALSHGLYIANGNLNLTSSSDYTFGSDQNYVILVDGDLTISNRIKVPIGSSVSFVVNGDITINRDLGESATSTTTTIEGVYSADGDFILDGYSDCVGHGEDLRVNVAGNIVAGAGEEGGSFTVGRDLCSYAADCPVLFISSRPDFMLNLPTLMRYNNYAWQEIAP